MKLMCRIFGCKPKELLPMTQNLEIGEPVFTSLCAAYRDVFAQCARCGNSFQVGSARDGVLSGRDGKCFYSKARKEPDQ